MPRLHPRLCIPLLVLLLSACTSNTLSSTRMTAASNTFASTTIDSVDAARKTSAIKAALERIFRQFEVAFPSLEINESQQVKIAKLSAYRELMSDIQVDQVEFDQLGSGISTTSIRTYLSELVQHLDELLAGYVSYNDNSVSVAAGKLAYHLSKLDSLKKCYLELKENC